MLIVGLLAWNFVGVPRIHPHELSYFNEIVGGPSRGHDYLLESSDWGQDLTFLKRWIDDHPEVKTICLAFAGNSDPSLLGINYKLPPLGGDTGGSTSSAGEIHFDDAPVYCAVSTQLLHGYDWSVHDGGGGTVQHPWGAFRYFSSFDPIDRAGYSILIYKIPARQPLERARTFTINE